MANATFFSKSTLYEGDYNCVLRNADNEFSLTPHYHDFYEFVVYLGNAGVFYINNNEYLVQRGDIVLIDMFKTHTLHYNKNIRYERFSVCVDLGLLISFSTSTSNLLDVFHQCNNRLPVYHLSENQLEKYITILKQYQKNKLAKGNDILEKAMIHQLLAYVYNDCYSGKRTDETDSQHAQTFSQLLNFISEHLHEEINLEMLAAEVSYSEYYVSRLFKKMSGKTITNYIQEKRIENAACLIRSGTAVNQAAEQVGFNNYSYFYKTFKKITGYGPADYQELHHSQN